MNHEDRVKARLAALIKDTLQSRDWNQSTLARQAGLARDSVSRYARGISLPSTEHAQKLARVLNVDVQTILGVAPEVEVSEVNIQMTPNGKYLLSIRKELDSQQLKRVLDALDETA